MGRTSRWISAAPALALVACTVTSGPPPTPSAPAPPEAGPGSPPAQQPAPFTRSDPPAVLTSNPSPPTATAGPSQDPPKADPDPPGRACKLPAPKKSEDACKQDSDCGVSEPCHAAACVAKAKSNPPKADTMCTRMLACHSADVNRCGCFEGRCALIPPP